MFEQNPTEGPGIASMTDHTLEIVIMLLVAFILGYLLRLVIKRGSKTTVSSSGSTEALQKQLSAVNADKAQLESELNKWKKEATKPVNNDSKVSDLESKLKYQEEELARYKKELLLAENRLTTATAKKNEAAPVEAVAEKVIEGVKEVENKVEEVVEATVIPTVQTLVTDGTDEEDDLKKLDGIGPKIEQLLKAAGISTYSKLSQSTEEQLRAVLDEAGPLYRIHNPKSWPKQAELAEKGDWDELKAYQQFLSVGGE